MSSADLADAPGAPRDGFGAPVDTRVGSRIGRLFGASDQWVRPRPATLHSDIRLALVGWAIAADALELMRIMGVLGPVEQPVWAQHLAIATGMLPLALRRWWPLTVAAFAGLHMFVVGVTQPMVMASVPLQVAYFLALFSGVAWARDRQQMALLVGLIVALMFLWVAVVIAVQSGLEHMLPPADMRGTAVGPITPAVAAGIYIFLVNSLYFGGAILLGQRAWVAARHTDEIVRQRAQLAAQAQRLQEQAVIEERLRIARELHDVVAHHVSVMGVQAAGARSVLRADPARAEQALHTVEESSRSAVTQLRGLLGTLRRTGASDNAPYAAEPSLGQLAELVAGSSDERLSVSYELVRTDSPDAEVPAAVGLAVYRIVQESLTNVRRHSSANQASVVVRLTADRLEVEALDNGRPRGTHPAAQGWVISACASGSGAWAAPPRSGREWSAAIGCGCVSHCRGRRSRPGLPSAARMPRGWRTPRGPARWRGDPGAACR